jgi:hypothetical protein
MTTPAPRPARPAPKPSQKAAAAKATKAPAKAAKAPGKKAPAAKASTPKTGVQRTASTISKEGTQKDEFTGEVLPVTSFPTTRQKDGTYTRGTVARKNLQAWRDDKRAKREAAKAAAAAKKADTSKAKA